MTAARVSMSSRRIYCLYAKAAPGPPWQSLPCSIAPGLLTVPSTRISFAISAFDTQTGSSNPNGIFEAVLYEDDQAVIGFQMDNISYDNTRNINAHIDYKTRATGGPFLQHLFFLQGYPLPSIYRSVPALSTGTDPAAITATACRQVNGITGPADGIIDLSDGQPHNIRIEVKDAYGNASELVIYGRVQSPSLPANALPQPGRASNARDRKTSIPACSMGSRRPDCAFYLGEKSLYDSVRIAHNVSGYPGSGLSLPDGVSAVHIDRRSLDPFAGAHAGTFAASRCPIGGHDHEPAMDAGRNRQNRHGRTSDGAEKDVQRPEWQGGWASARFREFGNFQLVEDTTPPVITPLGPLEGANLSKASRIAFSVKDNLGAVRNFRAELDGKWLCFTNDKGLAYIYKFDEHCPPGTHALKVTVEDVAGNRTVKEYQFTRKRSRRWPRPSLTIDP